LKKQLDWRVLWIRKQGCEGYLQVANQACPKRKCGNLKNRRVENSEELL
jgi:hypothetical protein